MSEAELVVFSLGLVVILFVLWKAFLSRRGHTPRDQDAWVSGEDLRPFDD
jgi:hypothetical protein